MRETVRRRRLGAAWLLVLGLAYGLVEEGLVLQSLFNQHYPGLDFLGYYGHWLGVNWVWLEFIVPYHAVFSIAIPIAITELLFPDQRDAAWVSARGLLGVALLFISNALLFAIFQIGLFTDHAPHTSRGANTGVAFVAIGLVASALWAAPGRARTADLPVASQRTIRLIAVMSGLGWFLGLRVLLIGDGTLAPASLILLAGATIAALSWWSIARVRLSSPRVGRRADLRARLRRTSHELAARIRDRGGQRRQHRHQPDRSGAVRRAALQSTLAIGSPVATTGATRRPASSRNASADIHTQTNTTVAVKPRLIHGDPSIGSATKRPAPIKPRP